MTKRAFIFTLDALFAMLIAFMLILEITGIMASIPRSSISALDLYRLEGDALAGMDKDGTLAFALAQNSTPAISGYLTILPPRVCASVLVRQYPADAVVLANVQNCTCSSDRVSTPRAFIRVGSGGTLERYIATMEGCYT